MAGKTNPMPLQSSSKSSSFQQTLLRQDTIIVGATDAGVHAKTMVAHFDADIGIADAAGLVARLNGFLLPDIAIDASSPSSRKHTRGSQLRHGRINTLYLTTKTLLWRPNAPPRTPNLTTIV